MFQIENVFEDEPLSLELPWKLGPEPVILHHLPADDPDYLEWKKTQRGEVAESLQKLRRRAENRAVIEWERRRTAGKFEDLEAEEVGRQMIQHAEELYQGYLETMPDADLERDGLLSAVVQGDAVIENAVALLDAERGGWSGVLDGAKKPKPIEFTRDNARAFFRLKNRINEDPHKGDRFGLRAALMVQEAARAAVIVEATATGEAEKKS